MTSFFKVCLSTFSLQFFVVVSFSLPNLVCLMHFKLISIRKRKIACVPKPYEKVNNSFFWSLGHRLQNILSLPCIFYHLRPFSVKSVGVTPLKRKESKHSFRFKGVWKTGYKFVTFPLLLVA